MESKTLSTIQTFAKIGKILSQIVRIVCIVGFILCGVAAISIAVGTGTVFSINGVAIHNLIEIPENVTRGTALSYILVATILLCGESVMAKRAYLYFKHELEDGTPFTTKGAQEMLRLGIFLIVISVCMLVAANICYITINMAYPDTADLHIDSYQQVGLGVAFIAVSFLCKLGAEQNEGQTALTAANTPDSE